jgi:hypothetical protein
VVSGDLEGQKSNMRNDAAEMTPARQWLNAARQNRIRILNRWKEDAKPQRLNR